MSDGPDRGAGAAGRRCPGLGHPGLIRAGLFALAMIPLLATPVLPLIDFYNHLARFYVLSHVGSSPLLQTAYQAHWSLLPDIGVDLLATPLLAFVPPLIAGHLIVIFILAVLYGGVLYFHRVLTGQGSVLIAVLLLPLLYSYILNWGFANFLLGLGLAFWAGGWWLSNRHRLRLAVPVSCLLSVLIFLTHGIAFALYGILVASLEVGLFLNAPSRRLSGLAGALLPVMAQAVIPAVFFLYWMLGGAHGAADAPVSQTMLDDVSLGFSGRFFYHLATLLRVEEGPAYWFDIATFFVQLGAVGFLIWRRQMTITRTVWPLLAITAALTAIGPPAMLGVGHISDRMPLFGALIVLGALGVRKVGWTAATRAACGVLIVTVAVRLIAIAVSWHGYGQSYQEFRSIAGAVPPGSLTLGIMVGSGHHETEVPRCEMYDPLLIAQYSQIGPLFADEKQQPLRLIGALKNAVKALPATAIIPLGDGAEYNRYMTTAAAAGFDYLLVCNRHLLNQAFPGNLDVVAETPHFALLRAGKVQ